MERVAASVGILPEVSTRFEKSYDVPNAGVLCALPALLTNGLLQHTLQYFSLPKGYYSLVHIPIGIQRRFFVNDLDPLGGVLR